MSSAEFKKTLRGQLESKSNPSLKLSKKKSCSDFLPFEVPKRNSSDDWLQMFSPKSLEDLAVHANKIQEVKSWLEERHKHPNPILLLVGPPGCGKTATIRVLAEEKQFDLCEWVTPVDTNETGKEIKQSHSEVFKEFLFKASRYKSLLTKNNKRLLLVEDFPNFLIRDKELFTGILENWRIYGRCPLVFVVTETKSKQLNISFNLFPDSVRTEFNMHSITFNPISVTLMKKALQRISSTLSQEPFCSTYKKPEKEVVDSVVVSAMGDIRNAILNLQFVSQKDAKVKVDMEASGEAVKRTKGKSSVPSKKLKSVGRDETITLMHAIGRVFNPKYDKDHRLTHNPEALAEDFESQPQNFVAFIQANYLKHIGSVEDCAEIGENLSFTEFLSQEWRDDEIPLIGLIVATRGAMVHNSEPVKGFIPCTGPKKIPLIDCKEQYKMIFNLGYKGFHSMATTASDIIQYAKIINGNKPNKVDDCDET
ncbi:Rad17 [Sergentomyia squamirostris]